MRRMLLGCSPMMMRSTVMAATAAMSMMLGACVAETDDEGDVGDVGVTIAKDLRCPVSGCRDQNKVNLGLSWIHEVATGTAQASARLVSFRVNGVPVSVSGGDIVGARRVITDRELLLGAMV